MGFVGLDKAYQDSIAPSNFMLKARVPVLNKVSGFLMVETDKLNAFVIHDWSPHKAITTM